MPTNYNEQAFYLDGATATPGSGVQYISISIPLSANLTLKSTVSSTTGVVMKDTVRFLHDFTGTGATGQNVFLGLYSGNFTMAGTTHQASYNIGVGRYTLNALTTGSYNVAIGNNTLRYNDSGPSNVAVGHSALGANTSGAGNVAVGASALVANTTGGGSIALGYYAGAYVTTTGNELFINNQDRTNVAGDRGKSLLYGIMAASVANQVLSINGKVAINLSSVYATPSYELSFSGVAAKTVGMERNTTSNTAGQNLTILAGGATSSATDKAGGTLVLTAGTATGSGSSSIQFSTATAGGAGTTDRSPSVKWSIDGAGLLAPAADNTYSIGDGSYRVNKIIVGTGTSVFGGPVNQTITNGQTTAISMATAQSAAPMSGTTETFGTLIPAQSLVLGVTIHPTTAITSGDGGTTYSVGDGTDVDRWGLNIAFANDVDLSDITIASPVYYTTATNVVLTCDGGKTFNAGVVRATVHYISLTAPTS